MSDGAQFTRDRKADLLDVPLSPSSLVASWCHKLEDDVIVSQGFVVAEPQAGVYLIEFEFSDTGKFQGMVTIKQMTETQDVEWRFYDSEEWMRSAYVAHTMERVKNTRDQERT